MSTLETPNRIEPCLLSEVPAEIVDLVAQLSRSAGVLGSRLHPRSAANLADLVRVMNCYYSNLIEGHNTTPREIVRAMGGELDAAGERRDLQLEAQAHIRVQREIDERDANGVLGDPTSLEFIVWLHRAFYEGAPASMLLIKGAGGREQVMTPGAMRTRADEDNVVGRHVPPSSGSVADFMAHFARRYRLDALGEGSRILAIPAAHHRFNYIHPFPDGNGRVSRLMSHAMALKAGIGARGLWSIARGLARGLDSRGDYRRMMDHADSLRRSDLDGRGNLSEQALRDFTVWFLRVCLDQVNFMAGLFELETLSARLRTYVAARNLRPEAYYLLEQVLQRGEVARGEAMRITGLRERSAREVVAALVDDGVVASPTPKGALSLRFPLHAVELLFPALFPQT